MNQSFDSFQLNFLLFLVFVFQLCTFIPVYPQVQTETSARTQTDTSYFVKGQKWFDRRVKSTGKIQPDSSALRKAIKYFKKALNMRSNTEKKVAAHLLRTYYIYGEYVDLPQSKKLNVFENGKKLGERMYKKYPDSKKILLGYIGNLGKWSETNGIVATAREGAAGNLRSLCKKLTRIAPEYNDAAGFRALGKIHYKAPYVPFLLTWPSMEKASGFLREAIKIAPDVPANNVIYAKILLEQGDTTKAKKHLKQALEEPIRHEWKLQDKKYKRKARKLIETL